LQGNACLDLYYSVKSLHFLCIHKCSIDIVCAYIYIYISNERISLVNESGHSDPLKLKETSEAVQRHSPSELKKRQIELKVGTYLGAYGLEIIKI
jgi:hypothetical protein